MKVIVVSSVYGLNGGGAGIMASLLAHKLVDLGHKVVVITMGEVCRFAYAEEQAIGIYGIRPWNFYPFEEKDNHPSWQKFFWQIVDIYNLDSAKDLRVILKRESPDIIHIHKMRGFSGAAWSVATKLFPGHVVQTCHDYESMSPDGLMRGAIGRMALRRQWPIRGYQLIRARLSAGVSAVTAPSGFTLQCITASGLFPLARPEVIANTHGFSQNELRLIHQRSVGSSNNDCHFLYLGRLESEKGIVHLCEAFLKAFARYPSMKLGIAGWGSLESDLRDKYGTHPGVNFLGTIRGMEKERALSDCTAVVVPSMVQEVFGLVTAEAFAFGKPVIASNVGGLPELIKPGETGWLVEPGNVEALAERLEAAAKIEPSFLEKMSQNCKEYSYEFAVEKIVAKYLAIYNQLIK